MRIPHLVWIPSNQRSHSFFKGFVPLARQTGERDGDRQPTSSPRDGSDCKITTKHSTLLPLGPHAGLPPDITSVALTAISTFCCAFLAVCECDADPQIQGFASPASSIIQKWCQNQYRKAKASPTSPASSPRQCTCVHRETAFSRFADV